MLHQTRRKCLYDNSTIISFLYVDTECRYQEEIVKLFLCIFYIFMNPFTVLKDCESLNLERCIFSGIICINISNIIIILIKSSRWNRNV